MKKKKEKRSFESDEEKKKMKLLLMHLFTNQMAKQGQIWKESEIEAKGNLAKSEGRQKKA